MNGLKLKFETQVFLQDCRYTNFPANGMNGLKIKFETQVCLQGCRYTNFPANGMNGLKSCLHIRGGGGESASGIREYRPNKSGIWELKPNKSGIWELRKYLESGIWRSWEIFFGQNNFFQQLYGPKISKHKSILKWTHKQRQDGPAGVGHNITGA